MIFKMPSFKKYELELNEKLIIITKWTFQWKRNVNFDPKKQAIEVCFFREIVSNNASPLSFNQSPVKISESHRHLDLILDTKSKFNEKLEDKINKYNRINGSIKKLSLILPRTWPHLDYFDIIYDKPDTPSKAG